MPRSIYSVVASRIRALRREAGLSMEALAADADLSPNFIGAIERGEKGASVDTAYRIAEALGTTLDSLAGEPRKEKMSPRLARVVKFLRALDDDDLARAEQILALVFRGGRHAPRPRRNTK